MEKPDFFKMAIDRNLYLAAPEVAEMCEIVWNAHVVPLQESLRIEREAHDKSMAEIKALREEIERLKINQPPFR